MWGAKIIVGPLTKNLGGQWPEFLQAADPMLTFEAWQIVTWTALDLSTHVYSYKRAKQCELQSHDNQHTMASATDRGQGGHGSPKEGTGGQ